MSKQQEVQQQQVSSISVGEEGKEDVSERMTDAL